jgi:hypothetical protein
MCVIWVEEPVRWHHKWYPAENRLRKDELCFRACLTTLVGSMNILLRTPDQSLIVPRVLSEYEKTRGDLLDVTRDAAPITWVKL